MQSEEHNDSTDSDIIDSVGVGRPTDQPIDQPDHDHAAPQAPQDTTLVGYTGTESDSRLNLAIAAWLRAKAGRTGSKETAYYDQECGEWKGKYPETLASYRDALHAVGLDFDSPDSRVLALVAQGWAAARSPECERDDDVKPATYNQRLSIVSSFFNFAIEQDLIPEGNPITSYCKSTRRQVYKYQGAAPILDIRERLKNIDTSTMVGKRDQALLRVGVATGARASELASLRWGDVRLTGNRVTLTFRRTKGGKSRVVTLPRDVSSLLLDYLHAHYEGRLTSQSKQAALWPSYSRQNRGKPIGTQTIGDICERHLGTSKVHSLRHTFAKLMLEANAPVTEIQSALGHSSLETTGRYLQALARSENPYMDEIDETF